MNAILLTPELIILAAGLVVLVWDIFLPPEKKHLLGWFALLAAVAAFGATFLPDLQTLVPGGPAGGVAAVSRRALNGAFVMDPLALFMKRCFAVCGFFVFLISRETVASFKRGRGEFYALSLFALFGMFLTASVNDFMSLFVALETVTVTFFVLVAYNRDDPKSIEAGVKLLVIGSLSAAILVYGIAFVYGATGTLNFDVLRAALTSTGGIPSSNLSALLFGAVLIFLGLGFKTSAVPLHVWVPDVYQGAPTPVTAYLSVGSKLAGFALVLRVFLAFAGDAGMAENLSGFFAVVAAMTLFYGNLGALPQSNLKRLMGYSSIGQCGYILIGIAAGWRTGLGGALFYMAAYVLTNMAAFVVIVLVGRAVGSDEIRDYKGLAKRSPLLALTLTAALLSLAGVPPFLGFFGKFMLIGSAFGVPSLRWLVIVGLVNVIIAMYYYLSVVRKMYVDEPRNPAAPEIPGRLRLMMTISVIVLVVGGMAPMLLERPVTAATNTLPVPAAPR